MRIVSLVFEATFSSHFTVSSFLRGELTRKEIPQELMYESDEFVEMGRS
jgi:hypothetical protein